MTQLTDEELDALDIMADLQRLVDDEGDVLARASLRLITALRAQLAAANARADRAEARGIKLAADRTLGLTTDHECRTAILALIEKPDAT